MYWHASLKDVIKEKLTKKNFQHKNIFRHASLRDVHVMLFTRTFLLKTSPSDFQILSLMRVYVKV